MGGGFGKAKGGFGKGGFGCWDKGSWGKADGKGGGKDKGKKGKGKGKGKRKGPSGPELERTRVTEEVVTGEVESWRGKYGFIVPTIPIEHEKASKKEGKLYVSMSDLTGGLEELTVGALCQFHVYEDASGCLGAEEVVGS